MEHVFCENNDVDGPESPMVLFLSSVLLESGMFLRLLSVSCGRRDWRARNGSTMSVLAVCEGEGAGSILKHFSVYRVTLSL